MMRVFAVATADTATVLDLIVIDPATGEVAFGTGAAEDLFDELAPIEAEDLTVEQVFDRIDGWSNDLLDIAEVPYEQPVGQVASLAGLARAEFNKKHKRGHGGLFTRGDAPDTPSAAAVKAKAAGDSGGIEEVKTPTPRKRSPKTVLAQHAKAKEQVVAAEAHSRDSGRMVQSDREVAARAKLAKLDRELRDMGISPITGKPANPQADAIRRLEVTRAKERLDNAEKMHGADRTKWTKKDQAAAKKLDEIIASNGQVPPKQRMERGAVAKAIATGQPDALAGFERPALMREVKKRNLIISGGLSDQDLRDLLLDNAGVPAPARPKTVEAALAAGDRDALGGFGKRALVAAVKRRGLAVGDPNKMSVDELADVLADAPSLTEINTGKVTPLQEIPLEKQHITTVKARAKALGIDMTDLHTKKQIADRIAEVEAKRPKTHTSKLNAHSLGVGDEIMEGGESLTVRGHHQEMLGGKQVVVLDTVDKQGRRKRLVKGLNEPVPRVVGGRTGGAGSFALELDADTVFGDAADDVIALITSWEMALSGQELIDFNRKHQRGFGGKFGHSLAKLTQPFAGHPDDGIEFPDGPDGMPRSIDWNNPDRDRPGSGYGYVNVYGTSEIFNDETGEYEPGEQQTRLHIADTDLSRWEQAMSSTLLRRELEKQPLDPADPRSLFIESLLDSLPDDDTVHFDPEENPWGDDQSISWEDNGDDTWTLRTSDEDGDENEMHLSDAEFRALHAQLLQKLKGLDVNGAQVAAAQFQAELLDYAEAFAAWAATEFDISTMPEHLQRYWTEGEGAAKVRWGTRGSFRRARRLLLREGVPLRMVNGTVANLYKRATGKHPGPHGRHRRNRTGPGRMDAMGTRIMLPMQTACAMCGNDQLMVDLGDDDTMPDLDAPSPSMGWRGPLAPVDVKTGDRRQFAAEALASRRLPLPFRWQEEQKSGHDGAVVVGALTGYSVLDEPYTMPNGTILDPGTIMGEGYFLDPAKIPQVERARYLVEHGLIGPSVDLEPDMDVSFTDEQGATFNPHTCSMDGSCPTKPTALITAATVAGATLVPITAFAEARAPELYPRTVRDDMTAMGLMRPSCGCSQVAAVRANGWDDLPFADRNAEWDKGAAIARIVDWASDDNGDLDLGKYGRAFLWHDDPADTQGAFKLPIADIKGDQGDELTIIPRAVFAVAARLNQTDIPATAKQDVRNVLDDLYDQMAEEFDDDTMQAPWEASASNEMALGVAGGDGASNDGCGCAEKWARSLQGDPGSQTAAAVFAGMEPYPADAFKVRATAFTPMTIDDRPDEPFTRLYGHIGTWSGCNRGHRGVCVPPPRSRSGYKEFHLGVVRTTEGLLPAGKIVMGEGHADVDGTPRVVRAFYDATSKQVAFGRMVDDEFGPFFSGVLAPGVTAEDATTFMMSPPSGHWTNFELMAILAVNVPGHVVPRAHIVGGQMANMVAAGRWFDEPEDDLGQIVAELDALAWAHESAALAGAFE